MMFATTAEAVRAFETQGTLAPAQAGFWKVWGAPVAEIRRGDLIVLADEDDPEGVKHFLIEDLFQAKAKGIRRGFVSDGERFTLGLLCPVLVFRWETHYTLSEYCR